MTDPSFLTPARAFAVGYSRCRPPAGAGPSLGDQVAARVAGLADDPRRLTAFVNGLVLDGTADRLGIRSGLAPFMTLPPAEARTLTRARMAAFIQSQVAATGYVSREDLEGAGFTAPQIRELFDEAVRIATVERMAA